MQQARPGESDSEFVERLERNGLIDDAVASEIRSFIRFLEAVDTWPRDDDGLVAPEEWLPYVWGEGPAPEPSATLEVNPEEEPPS